jgi:trehalose 6-phosphate phosphatase
VHTLPFVPRLALKAAPAAKAAPTAPPYQWLFGTLPEHKGALRPDGFTLTATNGVTLHFRKRPSAGPAMRDLADRLLAVMPTHTLMEGSMVWEVRPRGIDKGGAVRALMERPPFAGRTPLFVGDDVTDEDAIVAVRAMGGIGLRVDTVFGSPQGVRDWLAREAARG